MFLLKVGKKYQPTKTKQNKKPSRALVLSHYQHRYFFCTAWDSQSRKPLSKLEEVKVGVERKKLFFSQQNFMTFELWTCWN